MAEFVSFSANTAQFNRFVKEAIKQTGNLRIPFIDMSREKYKRIKGEVFGLRGPGKYKDLSDNPEGKGYKSRKAAKLGSAYPIFRGFTGNLERSITKNTGKDSVFKVGPHGFVMGTKVKSERGFLYPLALQEGTSKMPARPWLFIDDQDVRRWTKIVQTYLDNLYTKNEWNS